MHILIIGNTVLFTFGSRPTVFAALNGCGWSNTYLWVQIRNTHKSSDECQEADIYIFNKISDTSKSSVQVSLFLEVVLCVLYITIRWKW